MIQLTNAPPGAVIMELGGGDNPHETTTINVDVRKTDRVHFQCDFAQDGPWPEIGDDSADIVLCFFCLEHVPFNRTKNFLANTFRIVKPGGRVVFALPNTIAQFKWIEDNPAGWDGKGPFEASSEVLFGSQDYSANFHAAYFSPQIAQSLFIEAGFVNVTVAPYNPRDTDMVVQAMKPAANQNGQILAVTPAGTKVEPVTDFWTGGPVKVPVPDQAKEVRGYDAEHVEPMETRTKEVTWEECGAAGPSGAKCGLQKGHQGKHRAEIKD
jgi:SAM-dependent methyltransferase